MKRADLAGQRVGCVLVLEASVDRAGFKCFPWRCRCDCGNEFLAPSRKILWPERSGKFSCGCQSLRPLAEGGSPAQQYRVRRILAGFCGRCGKRPVRTGMRSCERCSQPQKANAKRHRYMTAEERFWSVVDRRGDGECWEFPSPVRYGSRWYGTLKTDASPKELAHRFSYRIHRGPIGDGLFVCHRCDNPPCVNPAHLFLGTIQDNTADMDSKGRRVVLRGEKKGNAKLSPEQVLEIWRSEEPQSETAARFGVSRSAVQAIHDGATWRHLTGGPSPTRLGRIAITQHVLNFKAPEDM